MLINFEFKKILRRKSTLIVTAVSLLVTAFFFGLPVVQYQAYNRDGVVTGQQGINYEKEQYKKLNVLLTDEYVKGIVEEYQQLFEDPKNVGDNGREKFLIDDAYWDFVAPREKLLRLIAGNFDEPRESSGFDKLPYLDTESGEGFYKIREDKLKSLLNTPDRELSQEQKEYWQDLNSGVQTPLQYGYHEGWAVIISCFELFMFPILGICIMLAPVFSGEYQAGTAGVILSAKYGKTKLVTAKIISSLLFGLVSLTLHVVLAFGITLFSFGADGWNLPLQISDTVIPYPLTFLEVALINLAVVYLILIGLMGLTLLLSANMKSPFPVLAVLVPLLFVPLVLSPSGTVGIYNMILFLLPYRSAVPEIGKFISYRFGGLVLDAFSMRAIFYGALGVITLPLAGRGFKIHRVLE